MIFHSARKSIDHDTFNIKLNNISIENVNSFNFLGITLDENLNWNEHINQISLKLSRNIGLLGKLKHFLPGYILKILYNSLILPHLTYGIMAWGNSKNSPRLFRLQKKAIRVITNSKFNDHTEPLFKGLNLLKLPDIFEVTVLKFYHNYCHVQLPLCFQSVAFSQRLDMHHYNIRSKYLLYTLRTKTRMGENSFRYFLPKIINQTIPEILDKVFSHSLQGFALYVKQNYISRYNTDCSLEHCYVCNK